MAAIRAGAVIPLEPKAFDVLVHLIEHRDRVVMKEELLDAVWPGTFVTPNVLTRAVAQIRKGLGDESQDARFVETVAKRGYRFIAPVTVIQPAGGPVSGSTEPSAPAPESVAPVAPAAATVALPIDPRPLPDSRRRLVLVVALLSIAAALAAFLVLKKTTPPADSVAADLQLKRLTNRRGYTGTPALAPDGRALVYASDVSGSLELYLASLAPGSAEMPLTKDGGHNIQPAWSPDGQWIAFHSRGRGGVWIVPSSGGTPQQVADFGSDPAWSPDSATLVFTSDAGGLAGQSSLWTIRRDGTDRRALTKIGAPAGGHRAPAWSHDGRRVAFVVTRGGWRIDVWTVDVASGATQLIETSTNAADPCFAPGDRAILWGGSTTTGNGRLFKRALDADGKPAGATDVVLPMDDGIVEGLSLAANGTLALAARTLDANLWIADVGADGRGSEPRRLTDDLARNTSPHYSRDGRVVYQQSAIGSGPTVWIMRDDGTGREPLVAAPGSTRPHWDVDGKRVLVVRDTTPGAADLAWVDVASRRVTPSGLIMKQMGAPQLSPDGKALAFHLIEMDGVMSVWTGRFDGTRTKVATDPEAVSYPAWSPDGQSLAVEIKRGDSTHIGVVRSAGGAVEFLTNDAGQSWPHSWAPDNDRIAFAGQRGGVWNVYTVSRRTRIVSQVTFFTSGTGYVRYPSWSPTGSRVVFERALETANVWTVSLPADR